MANEMLVDSQIRTSDSLIGHLQPRVSDYLACRVTKDKLTATLREIKSDDAS
jgi:hypothetical protein